MRKNCKQVVSLPLCKFRWLWLAKKRQALIRATVKKKAPPFFFLFQTAVAGHRGESKIRTNNFLRFESHFKPSGLRPDRGRPAFGTACETTSGFKRRRPTKTGWYFYFPVYIRRTCLKKRDGTGIISGFFVDLPVSYLISKIIDYRRSSGVFILHVSLCT